MRKLQLAVVAIAVVSALAAAPAFGRSETWTKAVHSVPGLRIPRVWTTVNSDERSPGFMFLTPRSRLGQRSGPTILDADGHVVWFHRLSVRRTAIDMKVQTYRGKPVITWGQRPPLQHEGDLYSGNPHTVYNVIADQNYHVIARVRAHGHGINTDLHEFQITRRGTALVLGFRIVNRDLRRYGGVQHSAILDNVIQEVDIKTGRVLLNWSAERRLSPRGSSAKPAATGAWDAYHINAISEDSDGNLLLTSRHKSQVIKIDRHSGRVIWKLGGSDSSFKVSPSARFFYPHDAQRAPDGSLTLFDNRSTLLDKRHGSARALRLRVDTKKRTVSLARAFRHPTGKAFSESQGNVEELPGGNVFVGWGYSPWFSEYAPDGHIVFAGHFESVWNQSYRGFKGSWEGMPKSLPSVVASVKSGKLMAYVSWNGATQVKQWQVLAGPNAGSLVPVGTVDWQDFETKLSFDTKAAAVQVVALDAAAKPLGRSIVVTPQR